MTVQEIMEALFQKAEHDSVLANRILATKDAGESLSAFCALCEELGYSLSIMDIVSAGEEDYDLMRRSINGGGGNHNILPGEDDPYEMLISELRMIYGK